MGAYSGPEIVNDGLVFAYDMGNIQKSWIGRPTTNTVDAISSALNRYNNPGFSGTSTNTGLTYRGMPIYELTFTPQDASFISRLSSGEGFGCFHTMGIPLSANTNYMASIYFRSEHPLQNSASQGFINTYSNITGWGQNGTSTTRYQEDGWTRLYSQYNNTVNGFSLRASPFQSNFTVNTTSTTTVDVNFTVPANGAGLSDFNFLHAIVGANPTIFNNGGLTGLSIVNHGLDTTNFEKLSWPSVIRLRSSDLPFNYFVRLSVPSTGGVNTTIQLRANFNGYYTALTDNKFWKITFDTTNVAVGQVLRTYWCAPMLEQHDTVYPSTFVNGTRSNTQALLDLTNRNTITATSLTYQNDGSFSFNGSSNYLTLTDFNMESLIASEITLEAWVNHINFTGSQAYINNWHSFTADQRGVILRTFNSSSFPSFWWCWGTENGSNSYSAVSASNITLSTNTWYHVVGTYKKNDAAKIYVNGNLINSATGTSVSKDIVYDTTNKFNVGQSNINSSWMNGQISQAKVYNRALTANEVAQNFNALRGRYGI
jgi:hypothetical protein